MKLYARAKSVFSAPWLPFAALIAVVFAAYANVYGNVFLYDDTALIVQNQFLHNWHYVPTLFATFLEEGSNHSGSYYRPLQALLYLIVFQIAGLKLFAFHLLNVLAHAANACLVFSLGRKLKFQPTYAFLAAVLWAAHPLHVEAVTYMSATADPLCAMFCLLGANVLLPDFSRVRIAKACLFFILALFSKESAIAFPLLAGSVLYYADKKRLDFRTYFRLWPLAALAVGYVAFHFWFTAELSGGDAVATAQTPIALAGLESFAALPVFLRLIVWPSPLYMNHAVGLSSNLWAPRLLFGLFIVIASTLQILRRQTAATLPLSWGLLWFFGALFPVLYAGSIVYEHWMYLPLSGLFLGVAESAAVVGKKHRGFFTKSRSHACLAGSLALAFVLGVLTWGQNKIWRDPVIFYSNIIDAGAPAPNAHINLGSYYGEQGDFAAALKQYDLAEKDFSLSTDTFTRDSRAVLQTSMATTLFSMPQTEARQNEALRHLKKAVEIDPGYYPALDKLAEFYRQKKDAAQAKIYQDKADALRKKYGTFSERP